MRSYFYTKDCINDFVAQLLPIAINLLAQTSLKFISYSLVLIFFLKKYGIQTV